MSCDPRKDWPDGPPAADGSVAEHKLEDCAEVAFWSHESDYPYVLGGHVTRRRETAQIDHPLYGNTVIETVEYGPGNWYRPVAILPRVDGEALLAKLKRISLDREKALRETDLEFKDRLDALLPFRLPFTWSRTSRNR